jgi:hypothetical protein
MTPMPLPDGDSATRRSLLRSALLVLLLVVPTLGGLAVARAGASRPPTPAEEAAAADPSARTTIAGVDQSELVSQAPLANAPGSAEDALTRQGDQELSIPRLTFVSDDTGSIRVENGGTVRLAGGYEVAVTIAPFPPASFDIDVMLELSRDGVPITDATVDTIWDMTLMTHGPFDTRLDSPTAGAYGTSFDFFMFGPWYVDTTVTQPGADPIDFRLSIYVWPA